MVAMWVVVMDMMSAEVLVVRLVDWKVVPSVDVMDDYWAVWRDDEKAVLSVVVKADW